MRSLLAVVPLGLVLAACPDAPTMPPAADAAAPSLKRTRPPIVPVSGKHFDKAVLTVRIGEATVATLTVLHFAADNNEWVNFRAASQQDDVSIAGPGRVQYAAGRTQAAGVLTIPVDGGTLVIDLAQLDGRLRSPIVPIGPGGGCIVADAVLLVQGQAQPVTVWLEWGATRAP